MRALTAATASLVLAVICIAPAAAAQPITEPLVEVNSEVIDCGTFSATLERNFSGTVTIYVNRAGEPTRIQAVAHLDGSIASDSGRAIPLRGDLLVVIDLVKGTTSFSGEVMMGTQAGSGAVIQDTGRLLATDVEFLLEAGPHDAIDSDGAIFCTVFGA
jgi:hypothetical protein